MAMATYTYKLTASLVALVLVDWGLCRSAGGGLSHLSSEQAGVGNGSDVAPNKYITRGQPTAIGQYPWVVHLNVASTACGGSLISYRHVLTAAHCVVLDRAYRIDDVNVYVAEYDTRTPTDCVGGRCVQTVVMKPEKIVYHNQYNSRVFHNDIAMLTLRGNAPNTGYIRPILLPTLNINQPNYEGTPLTITGWGQTEYNQASPIKLHAQVQLVSPSTCSRYVQVTPRVLCASSRTGQDMCFGDSGGPIMFASNGNYYLAGIVSNRISQCGSSVPSMYTNVYSYLDWIQNNMRS